MTETEKTIQRQTIILAWLWLGAILCAAVTYWAPWIDHATAALKLSGQDLGEFVKFLPQIRRGQVQFPRQVFYLPPLACSTSLALTAPNRRLPYPRWLRVGMLVVASLLLSGLLPPAWGHPRELLTPEFRLQALALVAGFLVILAHGLFRGLSLVHLGTIQASLALIGLVPTQVAFWIVRPRIWAAYNTPTIWLGWGLWFQLVSWTAGIIIALTQIQNSRQHNTHR